MEIAYHLPKGEKGEKYKQSDKFVLDKCKLIKQQPNTKQRTL